MSGRLAVVCGLLVLSVLAAGGSSHDSATQDQIFRSAVDRVRVDVVVTDSGDRPVTGLTVADFSIVENGKPQVVTDLRFVSVPVARRTLSAPESRAPMPDVATNAMTADAPSLETTMASALSAGVNVSGLTIRAVAAPLAVGDEGIKTAITVELSYPPPADGSRRIDDTLALSLMALDEDAKVKAKSSRQLRFAGSAPADQPIRLLIDDVIELPSQPLTLRVGVASRALGRAGTVQLPVNVPKPSDNRLQLSGIAIAVAGAPAPALNAGAIAALVPFQPTPVRTFGGTETLRVHGRAFWRTRDALTVTMAVQGVPGTSSQPLVTLAPSVRGIQEATFDGSVPLSGLAPGSYVLEISARLKMGNPVTREVPFAIRGTRDSP